MFARRSVIIFLVFLLALTTISAQEGEVLTKQDLFLQNDALEQRIKNHISDTLGKQNDEFVLRADIVETRVVEEYRIFLLLQSLVLFGSILFSVFIVKLIDLYYFRKARKPIIKEVKIDRFPDAPKDIKELAEWHSKEYWRS